MILLQIFQSPALGLALAISIIMAIAVHEFAHAWMALYLGDPTAKLAGRLTLNPLAHLDFFGTLLIFLVGFGWGKPVPFNPHNLQKGGRFGPALIALAGPLFNIIMVFALGLGLRLYAGSFANFTVMLNSGDLAAAFFFLFIYINLALAIFNLIPVPPLDGSKILFAVLNKTEEQYFRLARIAPFFLLAVVIFGAPILSPVLAALREGLFRLFLA